MVGRGRQFSKEDNAWEEESAVIGIFKIGLMVSELGVLVRNLKIASKNDQYCLKHP